MAELEAVELLAADCRARGLTDEQLVDEVIAAGLLRAVPCPGCCGHGKGCHVCSGFGEVFELRPGGLA